MARADWVGGRLVPPPPEVEADSDSYDVDVASGGKVVVFTSSATNWVSGTFNTNNKAILVELDTGVIEVVSRSSIGTVIRGDHPAASADGRYVAFLTNDSLGLVGVSDWKAVRKDRVTGALDLVSSSSGGTPANNFVDDDTVSISGDGRYVAFEASSSNLGFSISGMTQVFVKDLQTGTLTWASQPGSGGSVGECRMWAHSLSDDGRFVTFICDSTLFSGAGGGNQVYVRDLQSGTLEVVSRGSGVSGAPSTAFSGRPSISPSGRLVAFLNPFYAGLGGTENGNSGVYLRDRQAATTVPIPVPSGANAGSCTVSDVSDIGTLLMQCTTPTAPQVFLYVPGLAGGPVLLSSNGNDMPGNLSSGNSVAMDASGLSMAFESQASDLVDGDNNGRTDIFVLVDEDLLNRLFADGFED